MLTQAILQLLAQLCTSTTAFSSATLLCRNFRYLYQLTSNSENFHKECGTCEFSLVKSHLLSSIMDSKNTPSLTTGNLRHGDELKILMILAFLQDQDVRFHLAIPSPTNFRGSTHSFLSRVSHWRRFWPPDTIYERDDSCLWDIVSSTFTELFVQFVIKTPTRTGA